MAQSTDGQICFGIKYEEGYEFPWGNDIEEWWMGINGYAPPFKIYDEDGNYLDGLKPTKEKFDAYYHHRDAFKAAHPIPVELVNYCSDECPNYILAVPGTVKTANRGYPEEINRDTLTYCIGPEKVLVEFCRKYCPTEDLTPKWWLSSYWG